MENKVKTVYYCFPEGKHKALTMSYDDGCSEDRRLVEIFNKNGIKGTFNLNAGLQDYPERPRIRFSEMKELYKGHEIASHTLTHPTIERCNLASVAQQVLLDREMLEKVVGYPVRGMAYPNGSYTDEIKRLLGDLGIRYSRVVGSSDNFALPRDLYEWKATCHHNHNLAELGEQFLDLHKKQYLYLMYVWGHSFEFTTKDNWNVIEDFCAKMGGKDDIWYCTNIEYVDWQDTMKRLCFASDSSFVYNPSAQAAWLSVDGEIRKVNGGETVWL